MIIKWNQEINLFLNWKFSLSCFTIITKVATHATVNKILLLMYFQSTAEGHALVKTHSAHTVNIPSHELELKYYLSTRMRKLHEFWMIEWMTVHRHAYWRMEDWSSYFLLLFSSGGFSWVFHYQDCTQNWRTVAANTVIIEGIQNGRVNTETEKRK